MTPELAASAGRRLRVVAIATYRLTLFAAALSILFR